MNQSFHAKEKRHILLVSGYIRNLERRFKQIIPQSIQDLFMQYSKQILLQFQSSNGKFIRSEDRIVISNEGRSLNFIPNRMYSCVMLGTDFFTQSNMFGFRYVVKLQLIAGSKRESNMQIGFISPAFKDWNEMTRWSTNHMTMMCMNGYFHLSPLEFKCDEYGHHEHHAQNAYFQTIGDCIELQVDMTKKICKIGNCEIHILCDAIAIAFMAGPPAFTENCEGFEVKIIHQQWMKE